jgi:hypothetical protein
MCNARTLVIPGHGELTDVHGLAAQGVYFQKLRSFVRRQIDAGASREAIVAMHVPDHAKLGFERMEPNALGVAYDELMEK